jgi:hypothetical protein
MPTLTGSACAAPAIKSAAKAAIVVLVPFIKASVFMFLSTQQHRHSVTLLFCVTDLST